MKTKTALKIFFENYNINNLPTKQEIYCLNMLSEENYSTNFSKNKVKAGAKNVGKNF